MNEEKPTILENLIEQIDNSLLFPEENMNYELIPLRILSRYRLDLTWQSPEQIRRITEIFFVQERIDKKEEEIRDYALSLFDDALKEFNIDTIQDFGMQITEEPQIMLDRLTEYAAYQKESNLIVLDYLFLIRKDFNDEQKKKVIKHELAHAFIHKKIGFDEEEFDELPSFLSKDQVIASSSLFNAEGFAQWYSKFNVGLTNGYEHVVFELSKCNNEEERQQFIKNVIKNPYEFGALFYEIIEKTYGREKALEFAPKYLKREEMIKIFKDCCQKLNIDNLGIKEIFVDTDLLNLYEKLVKNREIAEDDLLKKHINALDQHVKQISSEGEIPNIIITLKSEEFNNRHQDLIKILELSELDYKISTFNLDFKYYEQYKNHLFGGDRGDLLNECRNEYNLEGFNIEISFQQPWTKWIDKYVLKTQSKVNPPEKEEIIKEKLVEYSFFLSSKELLIINKKENQELYQFFDALNIEEVFESLNANFDVDMYRDLTRFLDTTIWIFKKDESVIKKEKYEEYLSKTYEIGIANQDSLIENYQIFERKKEHPGFLFYKYAKYQSEKEIKNCSQENYKNALTISCYNYLKKNENKLGLEFLQIIYKHQKNLTLEDLTPIAEQLLQSENETEKRIGERYFNNKK